MERYLRSVLVALALVIIQTTFIPYISLSGYVPDLFIPWIVYLALRRGQMEATASGFAVGVLQDIITTRFFGLAALSKTIGGFIAGYFFNENTTEQTLGSYRYVLIVVVCSLVHNLIYFAIFFQGIEGSVFLSTLQATIATTLYTGAISVLPMFAFSQKYSTSWAQ